MKWLLEEGCHIETFEMNECTLASSIPKDFALDDDFDYKIKNLIIRGALNKKEPKNFFYAIKASSKFRAVKITVSTNDAKKVADKCFKDTNVVIILDKTQK